MINTPYPLERIKNMKQQALICNAACKIMAATSLCLLALAFVN